MSYNQSRRPDGRGGYDRDGGRDRGGYDDRRDRDDYRRRDDGRRDDYRRDRDDGRRGDYRRDGRENDHQYREQHRDQPRYNAPPPPAQERNPYEDAITPASYNEPAVMVDSAPVVPGMTALMLANNPQIATATRPIRRAYVGNLPAHLPLNETVLADYFTLYMKYLGFTTPDPIIGISLHQDRTYCFVEFRSVADTDAALIALNGAEMAGKPIRLNRPKDFTPGTPDVQDFIVGYPPGSFRPPSSFISAATGESKSEKEQLHLKLAQVPHITPEAIDRTLPMLLPAIGIAAERAADPVPRSRLLCLSNMASNEDLVDEEVWLDIVDDIREEFDRTGPVERVIFPRPIAPMGMSDELDIQSGFTAQGDYAPWTNPDDLGKTFVLMYQEDDAADLHERFHNKVYADRIITVHYEDESYLNKYFA